MMEAGWEEGRRKNEREEAGKRMKKEKQQYVIHLSTASAKRGCRASCIRLLRNEMSCHVSCCLAC